MRKEPPAAFTGAPRTETHDRQYDPLQLCIYTTVGILSWLITPALTVTIFGAIGVVGYARARRRGLAKSRCKLGDTRLVIAYLAVAALAGAAATASSLIRWVN